MDYLLGWVPICIAGIYLLGCGGQPSLLAPPNDSGGPGLTISGTMHDSLTGQPVSQGWAVLESGTQLPTTPIYNFAQIQRVGTDSTGTFQISSSAIADPAIVVLVALDASGKAYPPFIAPIPNAATTSKTVDLGTIPMGGCTVLCAFEGQEQTSEPAMLTGIILTSPISKAGSVIPQYAIAALDGTKDIIWNVVMPVLNNAQTFAFNTTALGCSNQSSPCSTYTFKLPSQKPFWAISGGYQQQTGAPVYSIYASAGSSCSPAFVTEVYQQDGTSPLTATAGAQLQVPDINFTNCQ
jgi:hypothetical protein